MSILCRSLMLVSRRAMASASSKSPTGTDGHEGVTTKASESAPQNQAQVVKKEGAQEEFINYNDKPGYKPNPNTFEIYLNPLLTPPPRSPRTPEDFKTPSRLGHWVSLGYDYTNPVVDKYRFHEFMVAFVVGTMVIMWIYSHLPDYKYREWAKREAFLRTAKREALGLPLIDRNVVDPARIVLPTEEELGDFPVHQ